MSPIIRQIVDFVNFGGHLHKNMMTDEYELYMIQ